MRPQTPISQAAEKEIQELLASARKRSDFQRIQCIWLRVKFQMSAEQVALITNLKKGTVRKIWSQYLRYGNEILFTKRRGGRRNCNLSVEEETTLLSPYLEKAEQGSITFVAEIKAAYEGKVGKNVSKSTIYRMLKRHGWKKKADFNAKSSNSISSYSEISEYWIDGCSQAITPPKRKDISQEWLNSTLKRMVFTQDNN